MREANMKCNVDTKARGVAFALRSEIIKAQKTPFKALPKSHRGNYKDPLEKLHQPLKEKSYRRVDQIKLFTKIYASVINKCFSREVYLLLTNC